MIAIVTVWLCLITHVACDVVITINNNGDNNTNCCVKGTCSCSSLSSALHNVSDNTVINITSESVTLHCIVRMGSGNLNNITITGNGATIMCNNTGGVYCESCNDITIMGITWYQCGHKYPVNPTTQIPALNFTIISNISIYKCTFQRSSGCPVYINSATESIIIEGSYFLDNIFDASQSVLNCAGLYIDSGSNSLRISIISNEFRRNGCGIYSIPYWCDYCGIVIALGQNCELAIIVIESTEFSNNSHGLHLDSGYTKNTTMQLSHVNVSDNMARGISVSLSSDNNPSDNLTYICIDMSFVNLTNNVNALSIITSSEAKKLSVIINANHLYVNNNIANDAGIFSSYATKLGILRIALMSSITSVTIKNSHFSNNFNGAVGIYVSPPVSECESMDGFITFIFRNVTFYNTTTNDIDYASIASVSVVTFNTVTVITVFTNVNFTSNNYSRHNGEVLLIENNAVCKNYIYPIITTNLSECTFDNNNNAFDHVVFLHMDANTNSGLGGIFNMTLSKCNFSSNNGGKSIVYIHRLSYNIYTILNSVIMIDDSKFNNNVGTALYSTSYDLKFKGNVSFINNRANSGAAMYFEEVHCISSDNADVLFINNSAAAKGGALYFNLVTESHHDQCNVFSCNVLSKSFNASFINNSANIAGNSIYFSIPWNCHIVTDTSNKSSLLYVLNRFSYSQPVQVTGSPVVTSPHNIKLYPSAAIITSNNSSNTYSLKQSIMLSEPVQFTASVFDYFNNIAEPVIFSIDCKTCDDHYVLSTYQIIVHNQSLNELKVLPISTSNVFKNVNITIAVSALLSPIYKSINASLSIELSPCHAGYLFKYSLKQCICYPHPDIVHCSEDSAEIQIGYWIGYITRYYTSTICPSNYCNFGKRTETSPGYYYLPRKADDQCSSHRTGVVCGECKSGYTLAYDFPDCINTNKCSAGITILVILLTILYWIAVVAVVFGLMYFQFQISSGYAYGIIYYYSIVDILLINDVSEEVFQLIAILSSFAKLTPQLFGQLCLVEGLSGIDQQFIHYSHALAVSLILLVIVLVARYSARLTRFVGPCIIRVICILLLLSYTSLASTSLQLLRPLTFNDVDDVRTYSSPDIKYFTGRHFVYTIVAILCEVIVAVGFPLLLLFEPFLSLRVNFVKIKPLLDQFQGCYKDKYRWFAGYYLICRQVIFLIVYVGNGDYYNMLYYLQTACVIIAMIHGWVQPYKSNLLNGFDEVILLILVLVVNVNTFPFLSSVLLELSVVLIMFPLLLLSLIVIKKLFTNWCNRKRLYLLNPVDANGEHEEDEENDSHDNEANVRINTDEINDDDMHNEFQESLLNYSDN